MIVEKDSLEYILILPIGKHMIRKYLEIFTEKWQSKVVAFLFALLVLGLVLELTENNFEQHEFIELSFCCLSNQTS